MRKKGERERDEEGDEWEKLNGKPWRMREMGDEDHGGRKEGRRR